MSFEILKNQISIMNYNKINNPDVPALNPACDSACNPDSGVTWVGHLRLEALPIGTWNTKYK